MESNDVLLACTIGDLRWLKEGLAEGIDPNTRNNESLNSLHLAVKSGKVDCIKYLLANCSLDVNEEVLTTGNTSLHCLLAVNKQSQALKCLKLLLEHGGDYNRKNTDEQTPLHFAARFGHIKCLKVLLDQGADIFVTDKDGQTAYDLACLHGQLECARLLRALHWAKRKDTSLNSKLKKHSLDKNQEQQLVTLQTKFQKEAADVAYSDWLKIKNASNSRVFTPTACGKRKEVHSSLGQRSLTCATCTKATSRLVSGSIPSKYTPRIAYPIRVNPHQEMRNVESVGKPDKLYPYTNYLPTHLRPAHSEEQNRKANTPKSGRSSKATFHSSNYHSSLMLSGKRLHTKARKTSRNIEVALEDLDKAVCSKTDLDKTGCCKTDSELSVETGLELNDEHKHESSARETVFTDQTENFENVCSMSDNPKYTEDDDEDLFFHDVGNTNNLDALALPDTLTRDKAPAEVLQLLRSVGGGTASQSFKRSQSMVTRRSSIQNHTRRQSLSAIPEGRMVTSYSDDECSTSQLLDKEFVEVLLRNLTKNWETNTDQQEETTVDQAHIVSIDKEEVISIPEGCITSDNQVSPGEMSSPIAKQLNRNITAHIPDPDTFFSLKPTCSQQTPPEICTYQKYHSPLASTDGDLKTLKIVNIAWDPHSNNVQSTISSCPLTPPPDLRHRQLPFHKLAPRPTVKKFPSQKSHSHFSKETWPKANSISGSPVPLFSPSLLQVEGEDGYLESSLPSPLSSKSFFTPVPFHPESNYNPDTLCHSSKSTVLRSTDTDKQDVSGLKRVMSAPEMRRLS